MAQTVTLVVPVYNEIRGLREIMPKIRREWCDQILIIDAGSTDGSLEFSRSQGYEIVSQTRPGMRMAYLQAYSRMTGDIVITFSPDGNSLAESIPDLIAKMREGYDMVIASRYLGAAKSHDDTWLTGWGNWVFTKLIALFGYPYTDAMVMFRAWRRQVPAEVGLTKIRGDFYERWIGRRVSWEPQLSARCARRGLKIAEIPSDEPPRLEDPGGIHWLPPSRIQHFRAGLVCLIQLLEDAVFFH